MAVGLAVEFVVHVATAFLNALNPVSRGGGGRGGRSSSHDASGGNGGGSRWWGLRWLRWVVPRRDPGREARAKLALSSMGASVFSVRFSVLRMLIDGGLDPRTAQPFPFNTKTLPNPITKTRQ